MLKCARFQHYNNMQIDQLWCMKNGKIMQDMKRETTPDGTRTHNLWIRSPTPYPLGHRGWWFEWSASPTKSVILKQHGITIPLFLYEEMNKPFVKKKYGTLHEFACHPCAGAMPPFASLCFGWTLVRGGQSLQDKKNCLHFSICACHPCAGAMLIFSVSFQF